MNTYKCMLLLLFLISINVVATKNTNAINFIKEFIKNERKPTFLVYDGLCWNKNQEIELVVEMSKAGIRTSKSMEPRFKYQNHQLLFMTDLDCSKAEEIISNAIARNIIRAPYRWLVISSETNQRLDILRNSPLLPDSDLVLATRKENGYQLTELHKPSMNYIIQVTPRGYYNGNLTDTRPHRELFRRRRDLLRHPLTMSNVIQDSNTSIPHILAEDRLELHHDAVTKVSWTIVKMGFEMLNATPKCIFNYRWGYKRDGRWSGMIDDILTNKADLGTNCILFRDRVEVVAFTDVVAPYRNRFIFRQPPLSYITNIFSLPFTSNLWIAVIVCSAVFSISLYLANKWEVNVGDVRVKDATQLHGFNDALMVTMSAISQQGSVMEPKKASGRIMVWVLFTALMALYASYSANIVVLLQAPSNSIRTLAQLTNSKITLAAYDVDYNHFIFKFYKDPVRLQIYKKIELNHEKPHFYELAEGVKRIRQGLFAFHSMAEPVYRQIEKTFLETEKCDLTEVDFLNTFDPHMPAKKDSPYLELFRVVFKQIRESGILSAVLRRLQVSKPQCGKSTAFSSVGVLDLKPLLLLMLLGVGVSVGIAVIEIALYKFLKWLRRNDRAE